jgi:hypothetical protein
VGRDVFVVRKFAIGDINSRKGNSIFLSNLKKARMAIS